MNRWMKLGSCLTAVAMLLSMVSCGEQSSVTGQAEIQAAEPVNGAQYFDFSQEELYSDWRNENPVYAVFDGKTVQTSGSGITSSNGTVTVSSGGTYVLEGSLEGTLVVDAGDALVRLVMNGLQIQAQDGSAVNVQQADKVVLSLEAGTENILSDSESRSSEEEDAAVYSRDDLVINGEGTLRVNGRYLDGLKGNDDVKIVSGSLQISAVDDGLTGKDSVVIQTADLTVDAGGDGVKASNDTDAEKGLVAIQDGVYRLTAGNDGIQAETTLFIAGGNFELQTGGGSGAAVPSASSSFGRGQQADSSAEESESQKGLKAGTLLQAEGGNFSVDSCDDALHSNNSILISGGIYQLSTGDDAIHADTKLTVSGGEMEIAKSFEGLESSEIENATIRITSQDDGINISGGSDGETVGPRGRDSFQPASGDGRLVIGSGYLAVDASGDGIDINGSGEMNGGTLIAAGSAQMAQYPSEQSGQGFIVVSCSSENPAGTLFSLQDSGGSEIVTFEAQKRVQSLIVSAPDLKEGESYLLCTGGSSTAAQTDGLYENGGYQGGESQIAFDMESNAVYLDENGVTTQPGGAGGFGGGNRRDMARPDNGQGEGGARPQGEARDGGRGMQ